MGKRSLKASLNGQAIARQAFERTQWTQEQLAYEVGLNTRQSVWKFLTGRPIERHIFIDLCFHLNLDWQDIADLPTGVPREIQESGPEVPAVAAASGSVPTEFDANYWVEQLRDHLRPAIANQCGVMQSSLDLGRPLSLEQLYTPIRIVPHLRHQQWLDVADLQPALGDPHRIQLAQAHPEAIDAMTVIGRTPRVLLLGKPGSGKTTFLKHVANQCISGQYQPDCVPLFISLRHSLVAPTPRSKARLLHALTLLVEGLGLTEPQLHTLLQQGRFLILLDGLDEVPSQHINSVLQEIQSFTQTYPDNPCLITSRLTNQNPYLPGFFDVEVDDFSRDQIQTFVKQWFAANLSDDATARLKTAHFLEALDTEDHQPLKELVATPILLSLLCSVFLARSKFPKQRAKLYQAGLDILLQRWDQARGIQRDRLYQHLSTVEKLKLLGVIAATTFEKGQYFFEKSELLEIIASYIRDLADRPTPADLETLYLESDAILQAIQVQHGLIVERAKEIYSFSHLTFQEYLTARKILYQSTPELLTATIQQLATHTLDSNWHEVLRLTANMVPVADSLLMAMHQAIQRAPYLESGCQSVLAAIAQKAEGVPSSYHPAAVRAFYLTLFSDRDLRLATALDGAIGQSLEPELALDLALARTLEMAANLLQAPAVKPMLNLIFALELDQKFRLPPAFAAAFADLKQQLPELDGDSASLQHWWQTQGFDWLEALQALLIEYRHIGQIRRLPSAQRAALHQYYQLHVFLVDCWQESQVTPEFAQALMNDMLQPTALETATLPPPAG